MASLILVLREGVDQAGPGHARRTPTDQDELTAVANRLNELLDGLTAARGGARPRVPWTDDPATTCPPGRRARRPGPPGVRRGRDRGGVQRRPAQRDGGARVRPEREAPARLRRAREPRLPRRAGRQRRRRRPRPRLHRLTRTRPRRWPTCRWSSPRTGGPAARSAWSACSGPTRMAYPQAIGTVRFVSGLMNELIDHLYA